MKGNIYMRILLLSLLCAMNLLAASSYPYADRVINYLKSYETSFCIPKLKPELKQCRFFTIDVMLAQVICGQCPNIGGNKDPLLLINKFLGKESGAEEFCSFIKYKEIPHKVCGFQNGFIIE